MKRLLLCTLFCISYLFITAQQDSITLKSYATSSIEGGRIQVDGIIEEGVWDTAPWASEFTVIRPNNGDQPQRQTRFKILYDSENLYLAFHALHEDPSKIESRLARRDRFPGDWVEVNIDSYNDNNTAYSFSLSVSGVKGDEFITNNGENWDSNWNPIWYGNAKIVEDGWTAEIKIPFSQLRFGQQDLYNWGIQVTRRDFGADERSSWQFIPNNAPGFVNNFAELTGISGINPKRQIELQPYITSSLRKTPTEEGNPFIDGSDTGLNIGLDGKIGITNDITLDFTVNPDFGQVEADPSAINIDGFQIFFRERRPFFIENSNLFDDRMSDFEAGGPFGNDRLFYSRRIGVQPRGNVSTPEGSFIDVPDFTSILGAAKVSGKTKKGLSIGLLQTITAEESMSIDLDGSRSQAIVEPLTNYSIGTIRQDFKEGASYVGLTLTSVNRRLGSTGLEDQFHKDALSGGLKSVHTWNDREWRLTTNFIYSKVNGTAAKISETQRSFEHYFQRPDAEHLIVDDNKTSLSGHGGTISIGNYGGNDNMSFQSGVTWRSPELELNDVGFMNNADQIDHVFWGAYRIPNPRSLFRRYQINYNHYFRWTYGGEHLYSAINTNMHAGFKNFWSSGGGITYEFKDISPKALFGGPLLRQAGGVSGFFYLESDERKKLTYRVSTFSFRSTGPDRGAVATNGISAGVRYQPTDALSLSLRANYNKQNRAIQNVAYREFNNEDRYITARINQKTLNFSLRANYSITPNMTLEYWGQPFISRGNYSEFKYITEPLAREYTDRFNLYNQTQISHNEGDNSFSIDENGDSFIDYSFSNPDFSFLQFRSNLVFRWEYKPNSEIFLVWTQGTTNSGDPNKGIFPSLREDLFEQEGRSIFLFKLTYRYY